MIPLLGIAAWSGTGKTTLLKKLIPELCARGIRPGLIKHTHHDMDVDKPGKDSYELPKLDLTYLVSRMDASTLDMVLVEGFKHEAVAKIMLFREGCGRNKKELTIDEHVVAVASDVPLMVDVPLLDINDIPQIAAFILRWLKQ